MEPPKRWWEDARAAVGQEVILEIEAPGAMQKIREKCPDGAYLILPSHEELKPA